MRKVSKKGMELFPSICFYELAAPGDASRPRFQKRLRKGHLMTDLVSPPTQPVAIVGSGTLGQQIAVSFASSGGEVRIYDQDARRAEAARHYAEEQLSKVVQERKGAEAGTITVVQSLKEAVENAWMVVEAIPEQIELKARLFGQLDRVAPNNAILASNSSSIPSSRFIDDVSRPERVVNTHYYLGGSVVEVMSCDRTDKSVVELLMKRLPDYGLDPFEVLAESAGFIFNRIWAAIKREALMVAEEGVAAARDVDRIFTLLTGSNAGPFRQTNKVDLDVVLAIEENYAAVRKDVPAGPRKLLKTYVENGKLGVKSGIGFYNDYPSR